MDWTLKRAAAAATSTTTSARFLFRAAGALNHVPAVLPSVPVRQWVLSFPWPIRFLLSTRPEAVTGVLAIVVRALESSLIRRADLTRNGGARGARPDAASSTEFDRKLALPAGARHRANTRRVSVLRRQTS